MIEADKFIIETVKNIVAIGIPSYILYEYLKDDMIVPMKYDEDKAFENKLNRSFIVAAIGILLYFALDHAS